MLDKQSLNTYKEIRLQRDLRCAILERHEQKRQFTPVRLLRPAAALASLMLVVSAAVLFSARTGSGVYLDGSRITRWDTPAVTETVSYSGGVMRTFALTGDKEPEPLQTADECIPLTVRFGQEVYVAVNGGILLLPDADGTPTFAGQSGFATDGSVIYWIPGTDDSLYPLTAQFSDTEGNPLSALTLTRDDGDAAWHIAAEKNKNNK